MGVAGEEPSIGRWRAAGDELDEAMHVSGLSKVCMMARLTARLAWAPSNVGPFKRGSRAVPFAGGRRPQGRSYEATGEDRRTTPRSRVVDEHSRAVLAIL